MKMNISGKVTFTVIGAYCEDFINDILSQNISLENIRNSDSMIYADTEAASYPYIAELSRKYGVRVRIYRKKGLYFRLSGISKRPGLIAGILASALMVFTLRLFVWHIDIHGNSELSADYMLGVLEQYGFVPGVLANDTNALDAERHIMLSSDRIKWINIEVNGSRADVYMSENNSSKGDDIDYMTPCNIVASRSGVITETNVTSGKLMYEKGSGVAEGSVIVSGFVSSGDALILVHSDAEIIAEFTEEPEFAMNYVTTEKVPSDESFTHRQLMLLGIVIPLDGNNSNTSDTVCTEMTEKCSLWGIELPMKIRTETYRRYKEIQVTRSPDDIRKSLERQLEQYINNFLKDYELISTDKSFTENDSGITLKAVIKLRGNIAAKKTIYEH